ncbi:MAG: amidohydrolase family protein [Chloroflexi bacterium]|nr:amidohydrolase family protein [Chloroflexota bacterium]
MTAFDVIIRGGTVVDGTGNTPRLADIGVNGDTITVVGDLSGSTSSVVIEASGMHVAPGFIDAHGHSDYTLLADGRAFSQVSQGVTTEVIGNCGHGCGPLVGDASSFTGNIYGYTGDPVLSRQSFEEYLERLEKANPAINTIPLVPNGNLRISAVEDRFRSASADELEAMKRLLAEALDSGAWGLSLGLEYGSERSASFAELSALAELSSSKCGLLAVHTRNKEKHAVEAVQEAIELGRASGSTVQVSHVLPRRGGDTTALERIIASIESAHAAGLNVAFDVHTRMHGITHLSDALTPDIARQTSREIVQTLDSVAIRGELSKRDCLISSFALGGWERIRIFTSPAQPALAGRSISDLATEWAISEWDALFKVLSANAEDVHSPLVTCHSYEESDIVATARHPLCLIGSDATALSPDGPLADETFLGAYTWAGWIFSRLVSEPNRFTISEATRKLSGAVADRFGLTDRGYLLENRRADIVIFEPDKFVEQGTLDHPNVPCTGVRDVLVNGVITLRNLQQTSHRGGRVLRKGSST